MNRTRTLAIALLWLTVVACDKKQASPAQDRETKPEASSSTHPRVKELPRETFTPKGFHVPDKASKPPTVAEWKNADEYPVRNAAKLGCETKFVREWIRVSCRSNKQSELRIQSLHVIKPNPKPGNFYTFVRKDAVASIVFPIRRNLNTEIGFVWGMVQRSLRVMWQTHAKEPAVWFTGQVVVNQSKPACSKVCNGPPVYLASCHRLPDACGDKYTCLPEARGMCICTAYHWKRCIDDY